MNACHTYENAISVRTHWRNKREAIIKLLFIILLRYFYATLSRIKTLDEIKLNIARRITLIVFTFPQKLCAKEWRWSIVIGIKKFCSLSYKSVKRLETRLLLNCPVKRIFGTKNENELYFASETHCAHEIFFHAVKIFIREFTRVTKIQKTIMSHWSNLLG